MEPHLINTIAAFLTLAVLSFLWKDNPLYRFAEHLVVGVSAGYFVVMLWSTSFQPKLIAPMVRLVTGTSGTRTDALVLVPTCLGLLLFARFIPRIAWLARVPMAYILGVGSGASVPLVLQTWVIQQLYPTIVVFLPGRTVGAGPWLDNVLVLLGVICGLSYFYFSARHEGVLGGLSKAGIWLLMIGFGASFGYTVMSRISLLYGRADFLVNTWARPLLKLW